MGTCISIIGIDGCGKSTCFHETLKVICKDSYVAGIGDEVWLGDRYKGIIKLDKVPWGGRKRFLGKLAKKSRHKTLYQVIKFSEVLCRVNIQNAIIDKHTPEFVLTDGSPLINIVGWASFYHPRYFEPHECTKSIRYLCCDETIPLSEICFYIRHIPGVFLVNRLKLARFSRPDIVFFLNINPDIAVKRILARGEKRQIHEKQNFLDKLQGAYSMVCDLVAAEFGTRVHRISVDNLSISDTVTAIVEHIRAS